MAVRLFDLLHAPEASDTSALKNSPYRRADVGEYRIVYRVEDDVLLEPLIGKRNDGDVYKRLGRMG
ncbi:hypothetical protein NY78_4009 [Desulfovibrio sp. TomC]|nr:hypothetical protein NY78_4009 [Desulfovibrio sp. TomC]